MLDTNLYRNYSEVADIDWCWPNFSPIEIACRGDGTLLIVEPAMDRLQGMRDEVDRAMRINSAYRSPIYNAAIGGAPRSRHPQGDAFDISLNGHDRFELLDIARRYFQGFGFYQTFLHVDLGRRREWYSSKKARQLWVR